MHGLDRLPDQPFGHRHTPLLLAFIDQLHLSGNARHHPHKIHQAHSGRCFTVLSGAPFRRTHQVFQCSYAHTGTDPALGINVFALPCLKDDLFHQLTGPLG
ncbi:MAG: Uncharacterised protein [Flavobacteriia bacterium]|nr:MAG: Uncharacterised protein [Flavobacteriia bacterium]